MMATRVILAKLFLVCPGPCLVLGRPHCAFFAQAHPARPLRANFPRDVAVLLESRHCVQNWDGIATAGKAATRKT